MFLKFKSAVIFLLPIRCITGSGEQKNRKLSLHSYHFSRSSFIRTSLTFFLFGLTRICRYLYYLSPELLFHFLLSSLRLHLFICLPRISVPVCLPLCTYSLLSLFLRVSLRLAESAFLSLDHRSTPHCLCFGFERRDTVIVELPIQSLSECRAFCAQNRTVLAARLVDYHRLCAVMKSSFHSTFTIHET